MFSAQLRKCTGSDQTSVHSSSFILLSFFLPSFLYSSSFFPFFIFLSFLPSKRQKDRKALHQSIHSPDATNHPVAQCWEPGTPSRSCIWVAGGPLLGYHRCLLRTAYAECWNGSKSRGSNPGTPLRDSAL